MRLIPRVLKDVSNIDTRRTFQLRNPHSKVSTALTIDFPILVAPAAMQAMAHPGGEAATARAASQLGTVMILSTVASMRLSDVAKSIPKHKASSLWLQLYLFKNREFSLKLVGLSVHFQFSLFNPAQGTRSRKSRL